VTHHARFMTTLDEHAQCSTMLAGGWFLAALRGARLTIDRRLPNLLRVGKHPVARVAMTIGLGLLVALAGGCAPSSPPGSRPEATPSPHFAGRSSPTTTAPMVSPATVVRATGRGTLQDTSTTAAGQPSLRPSSTPTSTSPTSLTPTTAKLAPCKGSQFTSAITTNATVYTLRQSIPITLRVENTGSPCWSGTGKRTADVLDGCPYVTARNSSGELVWESIAGLTFVTACTDIGRTGDLPAGWSKSEAFSWSEDQCPTSGKRCSEAQVPAGTYTIAFGGAELGDTWVGVKIRPAVVEID